MKIPKIALVGRPNVGKSALFNRISKKRVSIVDEAEGVTRDRIYTESELFEQPFILIDTGGIDSKSKMPYRDQVIEQAEQAIEEADALIMVVDAQVGLTQLDEEVSKILHRTGKRVVLAVNKVDSPKDMEYAFNALGIDQKVEVSATHGHQITELLEAALQGLESEVEDEDPRLKIAIVGRANVGKSTLLNAFLGEDRSIVSDEMGTTRDSLYVPYQDEYVLIDTAGIRRKGAERNVVEKFARIRTMDSIEKADVCLLMIDTRAGMTKEDQRIANRIEKAGKGCVLLLNRWDQVKGFRMEHVIQGLQKESPFMAHVPMICTSATEKRNLDKIFPMIGEVKKGWEGKIQTSELNRFMEVCQQKVHPPRITGKRLRIYYLTQIGSRPPRFILFVNNPKLMPAFYRKYLINQFRKSFSLAGAPIRFTLKVRGNKAIKN